MTPIPTPASPQRRRRVLFVDDDTLILEGLKDALYPHRHSWQMTFVSCPQQALQLLEHDPHDVVVSDLRMPTMDGATLLERVRARCPQTVRIVLSGHGEMRLIARAAAIAHRMVAKPCDSSELAHVINSSCAAQTHATPTERKGGLLAKAALPAAPHLYAELTALLATNDATILDAAQIIQNDMGMAAKVLQLANSAYFGRRQPVANITQAVAYLGLEQLRALTLHTAVFREFTPAQDIPGISLAALERHGTAVAVLARALALPGPAREEAFSAGLLADVGLLILASHHPDELAEIDALATARRLPLHTVERDIYDATHADFGAHLLALWGLPQPITDAVAHHHTPATINPAALTASPATRLATILLDETPDNTTVAQHAPELNDPALTPHLPHWREIARSPA